MAKKRVSASDLAATKEGKLVLLIRLNAKLKASKDYDTAKKLLESKSGSTAERQSASETVALNGSQTKSVRDVVYKAGKNILENKVPTDSAMSVAKEVWQDVASGKYSEKLWKASKELSRTGASSINLKELFGDNPF